MLLDGWKERVNERPPSTNKIMKKKKDEIKETSSA